MDKEEFFKRYAVRNNGVDLSGARDSYYALVKTIMDGVRDFGFCDLPEFGRIYVVQMKGKRMRFVATGETRTIDAVKQLRFKPCEGLRKYVALANIRTIFSK